MSDERSLLEHGRAKLRLLGRALSVQPEQLAQAEYIFGRVLDGWGHVSVRTPPRWPSFITDDHSPYEFSVAFDRRGVELRFLAEVQASEPTLPAYWEAAQRLNRVLRDEFGASLDRLEAVEDLFLPTDPAARFALWHSVAIRPGERPDFKVYLNPQAHGKPKAAAVIRRAMERLGFASAVRPYGAPDTLLSFFALDLSSHPDARIKVYGVHPAVTAAQLERMLSINLHHDPGEVIDFCHRMGDSPGPYSALPVHTCLAYTSSRREPQTGTIHFPVRAYADNDMAACARIRDYLGGDPARLYGAMVESFAQRPLNAGVGLQTYASLRQQADGHRLTVYLSPEIYRIQRGRLEAHAPAQRKAS